jgi:HEPN domain-containing protein
MAVKRNDIYYARSKFAIATLIITFGLVLFSIPANPRANVNFNTYPLANSLLWIWLISSPVAIMLLWHSIYMDKQELEKDFSNVKRRHWISIGVFGILSSGVYPLWYLYARYRLTKGENTYKNSVADGVLSIFAMVTSIASNELSTSSNFSTPTDEEKPQSKQDASESPSSDDSSSDDIDSSSVIRETFDKADSLRSKAKEACESGDYDHAFRASDQALDVYQNALESVKKSDINSAESEDIRQKIKETRREREKIEEIQLKSEITPILSRYNQIGDIIDKREYQKAKQDLQNLNTSIKSAKETTDRHIHADSKNKIATLEKQRIERLNEVTELIKKESIPETIPSEPNLSVDYDNLADKEPIGGGGNADVTKATLATPSGDVTLAIKQPRMAGTLHTDAMERILDEAETWDKLDDHEHIVGVVEYDSTPVPWIAMEYMDAGHLGDRGGELGTLQALWTCITVTKGVRHAHRRGVAHLDLKPENVLFRSVEDGWDVAKVADWGLSKHLLDRPKSVEGLSPQYAAPEQFDEDFGSPDDITDIYQLGTVFYELFTGRPPFDGKPAKTMNKVLNEKPTAPSEMVDVPDKLDEILLTALAKEKDDRYDNIVLLRDDLQGLFDRSRRKAV